ncbi:hypothetical protein AYM40_33740 [Paraburkholderia phytofirmans OLGA172]|uniref:Uncharacterized protein n=1 Tax=Paraburkholderia phytofirmans OLGA172 TaxID=1417228 RepID=A0A160FW01_9BURK|nr:hypothetical protein [Paraburkholderia phytofirmans]ANB77078.1 hypothetical protein AYM40_33740 [Paraburkholderia phytofirmans OLGA172]
MRTINNVLQQPDARFTQHRGFSIATLDSSPLRRSTFTLDERAAIPSLPGLLDLVTSPARTVNGMVTPTRRRERREALHAGGRRGISLCAHKLGLKIIATKGKVEIQAVALRR